jgi:hypothetical protein
LKSNPTIPWTAIKNDLNMFHTIGFPSEPFSCWLFEELNRLPIRLTGLNPSWGGPTKTPQPKLRVYSTLFPSLNHIYDVCFSSNFPLRNCFEKPHLISSLLFIPYSWPMSGKTFRNQTVVKKLERVFA